MTDEERTEQQDNDALILRGIVHPLLRDYDGQCIRQKYYLII